MSEPLLKDIFDFFKNPKPNSSFTKEGTQQEDTFSKISYFIKTVIKKSAHIIRIWSLIIISSLILILLASFFISVTGQSEPENIMESMLTKESLFVLVFYGIVIAPLFEEIAFRIHLKSTPLRWAIFVVTQFFFITFTFQEKLPFVSSIINSIRSRIQQDILLIALFIFMYFFFIAVLYLFFRIISKKLKFPKKKLKIYFIIFYLSALYFGLIHTLNYVFDNNNWFLSILLVFPQIFAGLFMGYARVQYGLFWSIILHSIYNASLFIPLAILGLISENFNTLLSANNYEKISFTSNDSIAFVLIAFYLFFIFLVIMSCTIYNIYELISYKKKK